MFNIEIDSYVFWEEKKEFLLPVDTDTQWIAYLIEEGSFQYEIEKKKGVAHRGEVVICPPYSEFHRVIREALSFHFFRFTLDFSEEYLITNFSNPILITDNDRVLENAAILKKFAYDNSPFCTAYRISLLKDLFMLGHLMQSDIAINQLGAAYRDPIIQKAIFLLNDSIENEGLSIEEIAKILSVHRSYLSRKFKAVTNISPVEYRNQLRLRKAQKLLIETDENLETIAESCGLSNSFYLSRIFSKYIGICPSQYRLRHKI